jgi:hypothetical protein
MEIEKNIIYSHPKHFPFDIKYNNGYIEKELVPHLYAFKYIFFTGRGHILKKKFGLLNIADDRYSFYNWGIKKKILFIFRGIRNLNICYNNNILLIDDWSNNPYHFIVDCICKLQFLETKVKSFDNYTLILNNSSFVANFGFLVLEKFSFNFKCIKLVSQQSINFCFGNLITTSRVSINGTSNRSLIQAIQKRNINFNNIYLKSKCKIYYFRRNTKRSILNNEEVLSVFKHRGFLCIDFASVKLIDILPMLQSSQCLIGLHGAGLANMVFLPKDSLVVEFKTKNPNPKNHCYWHLAQNLNLRYEVFIVDSEFPGSYILEGSSGVNVNVNISLLENYLDELKLDE